MPKKIRKSFIILMILVFGVLIIVAMNTQNIVRYFERAYASRQETKVINTPINIEVSNQEITIPSGSYYHYSLIIPKGATIKGRVNVTKGDNIHLYLMDGSGFNNFQNNKDARCYLKYESTRLQTFTFTSTLSTTYYLILQNPAILRSKNVYVQVSMTATPSQLREAGLLY